MVTKNFGKVVFKYDASIFLSLQSVPGKLTAHLKSITDTFSGKFLKRMGFEPINMFMSGKQHTTQPFRHNGHSQAGSMPKIVHSERDNSGCFIFKNNFRDQSEFFIVFPGWWAVQLLFPGIWLPKLYWVCSQTTSACVCGMPHHGVPKQDKLVT